MSDQRPPKATRILCPTPRRRDRHHVQERRLVADAFKYGPYRNGIDRVTPDDKVEFILARVNHCGICKRRTFDYRWYNRTPWWIVPRWLGGRMDCGGECMHCLSAIEEPDCDHEWQTRPINGTATATPQCSSYECVRCGSLLFETIFARSCATR